MLNRILAALGRTLIGGGVILLLFVAYQLWGTSLQHAAHQDELTESLGSELAPDAGDAADLDAITAELARVEPATAPPMAPPAEGAPLGVIEIPRIGIQQVVVHGVSKADLQRGPGHYPGTPLPGQPGNSGIAGHRTTYGAPFHRLDELAPGDPIVVTTAQGQFRYEVLAPPEGVGIERGPGWFSVTPDQTEVLDQGSENLLTLTACHPKRSARQRIVVRALLAAEPAAPAPRSPDAETGQEPGAGEELAASEDEADLFAGDPDAKYPAMAFGLGFLAVGALAWWIGRRWKPWASYLVFSVPMAVLLWFCFVHTDHWLPSF